MDEVEKFRKKVLAEKEIETRKVELESHIRSGTVQGEIEQIEERIKEKEYANKEAHGLIPDLADEVKRLKKRKEVLENE
tara:strand:+ start:154 stop:390 length:237 start_codon:yes stop_codon:yes gene_type:complete